VAPEFSWSLAIMCYNEAETLEDMVRRCNDVISPLASEYEIIIVNDNSSDGSTEIAERLAGELAQVRVVHHKTNKGIGEVLRTACREALNDWLVIMPGDLEFDPKDLKSGAGVLEKGVVVSYTLTKFPPLRRRMVSFFQYVLNMLLFGLTLKRVNWVKIVPTKLLQEDELLTTSAIIDTEIAVRLKRKGCKFIEIASNNDLKLDRIGGLSTSAYWRELLSSFRDTFKLWWALRWEK
jgi:glycosyltransferase involved in cell wall biosynthesis